MRERKKKDGDGDGGAKEVGWFGGCRKKTPCSIEARFGNRLFRQEGRRNVRRNRQEEADVAEAMRRSRTFITVVRDEAATHSRTEYDSDECDCGCSQYSSDNYSSDDSSGGAGGRSNLPLPPRTDMSSEMDNKPVAAAATSTTAVDLSAKRYCRNVKKESR
jgi:hypothetical protein